MACIGWSDVEGTMVSSCGVVSRADVIYLHVVEVMCNTCVVVVVVGAEHYCSSCFVSFSFVGSAASIDVVWVVVHSVDRLGCASSVMGVKESFVPVVSDLVWSHLCASLMSVGTVVREVVGTLYCNTSVT